MCSSLHHVSSPPILGSLGSKVPIAQQPSILLVSPSAITSWLDRTSLSNQEKRTVKGTGSATPAPAATGSTSSATGSIDTAAPS
jgi:hypothetical protein